VEASGHDRGVRETVDPDGRVVVLTTRAWAHIMGEHEEVANCLEDILQAIETPSRRMPGRTSNEEWFFLADAGPTRWLHVVVHFEGEEGRVTTAFGRRRIPWR